VNLRCRAVGKRTCFGELSHGRFNFAKVDQDKRLLRGRVREKDR
jgi:hypothetical protein